MDLIFKWTAFFAFIILSRVDKENWLSLFWVIFAIMLILISNE